MRDTDDDFWDLMKELDFKFEEKFKVSLSDYDKAAQYINDEYFKKRSSNLSLIHISEPTRPY